MQVACFLVFNKKNSTFAVPILKNLSKIPKTKPNKYGKL